MQAPLPQQGSDPWWDPATFLNLIFWQVFGGVFKDFSVYKITSSANMTVSLFHFLFWCLLFPFFFAQLLRLGLPITMLVESGKDGYLYFLPDLRRKVFWLFTVEYNIICGFVIYGLYCVEVCPSVSSLFSFYFIFKSFYWSIVDLHSCVTLCCTTKSVSYTYMYIYSF